MQPPPRKGKVTTLLKNAHSDQLVKLQMKHQQDSDFLDDIRNFTKMRAMIEKDYAQALLKLATSHLQKKGPTVPDGKSEDGESYKTVYSVWKTMLDETEKIARARLAATEVYQQQVSESAKSLRLHKLGVAKKCFENLKKMQEEIQICVVEIDKTKKLYFEEEHMAHEARNKAHDADEKLKRKKGRIFQSVSSLQKNSAKFSFRKEACDIQATKARNDYVLALIAANAHQSKYYENDLPELVQYIDCEIYDKVKEYILLIARTELLTCAACQSSFTIVQDQAQMATKQYTMDSFFRDNPVLSQAILYDFEPCDNDQITKLCTEHNAGLCLSKEARRWVACVTKEIRVTRDSRSELRKLLAQFGDKPPYALQSDSIGPQAELEARIDELRQIIRRSQTSKKKAEARLEAMKEAGVNIEEWVRTSESDSIASDSPIVEHKSVTRTETVTSRASRISYQSEAYEGSIEVNDGAFDDSDTAPEPLSAAVSVDREEKDVYVPDLTSAVDVVAAVQEAWDAAAETEEFEEPEPAPETVAAVEPIVNGEVSVPTVGQRCVALFSYEATNSDELSFVEQEELELIGEGDGDGWVMARNYRGEEGYIPQNYVEVAEAQTAETSSRPPLTSFSSVDYTMPNEDQEAGITVEETAPEQATEAATEVAPISAVERPSDLPTAERIMCCQAIYDYEATCDEELSFFEGQIIRILRKNVCDVDDGWWEGELEGQVGLFPSLVVEELKENGEPLTPMTPLSPPEAPPPPAFTPPEAEELIIPAAQIILTQPTPEIEHPNGQQQQAPEEAASYAPLVSSPDSPTKTAEDSLKNSTTENAPEEINTEIAELPESSVVITTSVYTAGDTPTSDDDMELKEPPKDESTEGEEPEKEETLEEVSSKKEEVEEISSKKEETSEEISSKIEETLNNSDETTKKEEVSSKENAAFPIEPKDPFNENGAAVMGFDDKFECTFPDMENDVTTKKVPSSSSDAIKNTEQQNAAVEFEANFADFEKMDVNGVEPSKNFGSDSQTTG